MRALSGVVGAGVSLWLAAAAALHLYFAGFGFPEPLKLASLHLLLFVPPIFLLMPARAGAPHGRPSIVDWALAAAALAPSAYVHLNTVMIYDRSVFIDELTATQTILGAAMVALVIEAVRRALSLTLALLVGASLLYMATCHLLPGVWYYRPMPLGQIVDVMYLMNGGGLYGQLTGMSATIVSAFLVFGAFMQASGMGRLFTNFGAFVAGRYVGGPAKVEVVSSALFGTMSGSSVANVVVTGSITIPAMIRHGYRPVLAAAIEAASSVGGAMMPPVMGAAAFIMAEMIAVPYATIIVAAALGSALYYLNILLTVHFESKRQGITAIPEDELPKARDLLADLHLVGPMVLLVTLMSMRYSAYFAAFWATASVVVVSWLRSHTRMGPVEVFRAFADAGRTICTLAIAVTSAGIVTAALTNTGLLLAFTGIIKAAAGGSLFLLAVLVAATCLFMGMGVPTTPAYIITAAIGAPLIAEHGVPLLAIHLFVFYFAVLADATPPVAAASYAAAAIGNAPPLLTGMHAFRLAAGGFICGLAYIYEPGLMLKGPLIGIASVTIAIATALTLISAGSAGFVDVAIPAPVRILLVLVGIFCGVGHELLQTELRAVVGIAAVAALFAWSRWRLASIAPPLPAVASSHRGETS